MEQAHSNPSSIGMDAAPLLREAVPATWLNLVCLDAPVVAVTWLCLFARTFHVAIQIENAIALFLTAWLIYLADRLADSLLLEPGTPRSARHAFCLRYREIWIATVVLVAGFDSYVIWRGTAAETFFAGAVVGLLAIVYLVLNHPFGRIWRSLPAKELAIGVLFCAGTMVALQPHLPLTPAFVIAVSFFAALCSLNCVSIASWERDLDRAQRKVSIVTRHPGMARFVGNACLALTLAGALLAIVLREAAPVFACISVSALLLGWLDGSDSVGVDQRTALADLVLLTPVVALILAVL